MQLTINDVPRQHQIYAQESKCCCFDAQKMIMTVALAALVGTAISLATGNFIAAIVCGSILGATVILGVALCILKVSRNDNSFTVESKPKEFVPTSPETELDSNLLESAKSFVQDAKRGRLPKPTIGNKQAAISMPEQIPVVIRTHSMLEERLVSIQQSHNITTNNGLSHIIIPKATLLNDILFEDRIDAVSHKSAMFFYYKNSHLFNDSAPEFAVFLSQCELDDLIGGNYNDKDSVFPKGMPRYDNVLLLKNGDISPIDFDTFKLKTKVQREDYLEGAKKAISLFPAQFEQIIDKVQEKMKDSFRSFELEELRKTRDIFDHALEEEIGKHYKFLSEKSEGKKSELLEITPEFYEKLKLEMHQALLELNAKDADYLGDTPKPILDYFDEVVFPHMIEFVKEIILPKIEDMSPMTLDELDESPGLLTKRRFKLKLGDDYVKYIDNKGLTFEVDDEVRKSFSKSEKNQSLKKRGLEWYQYSRAILNILLDKLTDAGFIANKIVDNGYGCTTIYY